MRRRGRDEEVLKKCLNLGNQTIFSILTKLSAFRLSCGNICLQTVDRNAHPLWLTAFLELTGGPLSAILVRFFATKSWGEYEVESVRRPRALNIGDEALNYSFS